MALTTYRFNLAKPSTSHAVALREGGSLGEGGFVVKMNVFIA